MAEQRLRLEIAHLHAPLSVGGAAALAAIALRAEPGRLHSAGRWRLRLLRLRLLLEGGGSCLK